LVDLDPTPEALRVLELLSVRFIVTGVLKPERTALLTEAGWRRVFWRRRNLVAVYENPNVLPPAYVSRSHLRAEIGASQQVVDDPLFDPWSTVVIESGPPSIVRDAKIRGARITRYEPNSVEIEARGKGWLVLTDTFYPGWVATVDDVPTTIFRANSI